MCSISRIPREHRRDAALRPSVTQRHVITRGSATLGHQSHKSQDTMISRDIIKSRSITRTHSICPARSQHILYVSELVGYDKNMLEFFFFFLSPTQIWKCPPDTSGAPGVRTRTWIYKILSCTFEVCEQLSFVLKQDLGSLLLGFGFCTLTKESKTDFCQENLHPSGVGPTSPQCPSHCTEIRHRCAVSMIGTSDENIRINKTLHEQRKWKIAYFPKAPVIICTQRKPD